MLNRKPKMYANFLHTLYCFTNSLFYIIIITIKIHKYLQHNEMKVKLHSNVIK